MTARTHDAFAFACLITVAAIIPPGPLNVPTVFAGLVGNIVGATIPDMDQATNRLWDLLPGGEHIAKVLQKMFLKHRTITHSFVGVYLIYHLLSYLLPKIFNPSYINPEIVLGSIMIGYLSHLIADSVTKDGLPLFFPLKWDFGFPPFRFLRITTGSWVENLLILPGIAAYIFWFIGNNQASFLAFLQSIS